MRTQWGGTSSHPLRKRAASSFWKIKILIALTQRQHLRILQIPTRLLPSWPRLESRWFSGISKYNLKIANLTLLPLTGEGASLQLASLNGLMQKIKRDKQNSHLTHQATVLPARITLRRLSLLPPSSVVRGHVSKKFVQRKRKARTKTRKDYMKDKREKRKQDWAKRTRQGVQTSQAAVK